MNLYEEAKTVYLRAERLAPNNYDVLNGLQNITRRLAGFYQEADRGEAAQELFEQTRVYINSMLNVAVSKAKSERPYLNALMARVRLNWQWERYPEAEASVREIISEYPEFSIAKEDLAAILLEFGQKRNLPQKIVDSKSLYKALYDKLGDEVDDIYIGSGLAEAVAFSKNPSPSEIAIAEKAVLLSIANSRNAIYDPYAFYAAAVLFH